MNANKQQIAIATRCGWSGPFEQRFYMSPGSDGFDYSALSGYNPKTGRIEPIPDYLNDLNAMHAAEKHLSRVQEWDSNGERLPTQWEKYCWLLKFELDATAAQRAEAFLKVTGKWKEDK